MSKIEKLAGDIIEDMDLESLISYAKKEIEFIMMKGSEVFVDDDYLNLKKRNDIEEEHTTKEDKVDALTQNAVEEMPMDSLVSWGQDAMVRYLSSLSKEDFAKEWADYYQYDRPSF